MQYPHLTEDQINQATRAYMMQIQSGFTGRVDYDRSHYAQVGQEIISSNSVIEGSTSGYLTTNGPLPLLLEKEKEAAF